MRTALQEKTVEGHKERYRLQRFQKNIGGFTYRLGVNDIGYQRSSLGMRAPDFRFGVAANTSGEYCQMKCIVSVLKT